MSVFHITLLYAGLLGLLLVVLSFNMMKCWVHTTGLGQQSDLDLRRAEALLSSFTDYVPIILLLMGLIESRGAPDIVLHGLGGVLVIARLLHAFGSNRVAGAAGLRFLGAQLTYLVLTVASFGCLYAYVMPQMMR